MVPYSSAEWSISALLISYIGEYGKLALKDEENLFEILLKVRHFLNYLFTSLNLPYIIITIF